MALATISASVSAEPSFAGVSPAPSGLGRRLFVLAAVLAVELLGIAAFPHPWCSLHREMAGGIAFAAALVFFGRDRLRVERLEAGPVDRRFAGLHLLALAVVGAAYVYLLRSQAAGTWSERAAIGVWFGAIGALVATAVAAAAPWRKTISVLRGLGVVWVYAGLCAVLGASSRLLTEVIWDAPDSRFGHLLQVESFRGVDALLRIFYRGVVSLPAIATLGTAKFQVEVAGGCSGIEGLGLMLALSVGWLIFARRELRLARAVWLVPVALGAMWVANLIRIAALIAIGDAGFRQVAVGGFHSEAGWILFNAVAIGFLLAANRVEWLHRESGPGEVAVGEAHRNVAAIYLLPFLAIVAASLVTQAVSSGFEWMYGLRLVTAGAVLWGFRREYRGLDWRFGWLGPAAGAGIFAMWLGLDHWTGVAGAGDKLAAGLAALQPWQRGLWLTLRVLAAVVTVPVAEELAFRGFIARRVMSEDVDGVAFSRLSWVAILVSSAAFGLMHGRMWLAGIAAGVVFALVAKVRGRLGEAVAAHATANLLIAVWVLGRGNYGMW